MRASVQVAAKITIDSKIVISQSASELGLQASKWRYKKKEERRGEERECNQSQKQLDNSMD